MSVTRSWRVFGVNGHRQGLSFCKSNGFDDGKGRIVEVLNSDSTGANEYSVIMITRESAEACLDELNGQLDDGFFENYRIGRVEEIIDNA